MIPLTGRSLFAYGASVEFITNVHKENYDHSIGNSTRYNKSDHFAVLSIWSNLIASCVSAFLVFLYL